MKRTGFLHPSSLIPHPFLARYNDGTAPAGQPIITPAVRASRRRCRHPPRPVHPPYRAPGGCRVMSRREAPPAPPVHENTIASPATWEGEALDMLAHDLRNALAPIVTALDLLHLQGPDHPIVAQAGRLIRRQADVLARLADHLGSVARHADPGAAPRAGRRQARGRYQVLVIDDNRDAADSLAALLEAQGHAVRVAYDGPAAVTALEAATPDVCLLDLDLPGMSGYEVAARLRQK